MNPVTIAIIILTSLLMSACSSSGDSPVSNEQPEGGVQSESAALDETTFIGTWSTECLPSTEIDTQSTQDSFVYDGHRALFVTQQFWDTLCENTLSFVAKSGRITFGNSVVESTYGVTSNEFEFISDDSLTDDFLDIIYTRGELLYFGDINSKPGANQAPVSLDASRTHSYSGFPDYSSFDSLLASVPITIEVEHFNGNLESNNALRAIDVSSLFLTVTIHGVPVDLTRTADKWVGQSTVAANSTFEIDVTWEESYRGQVLKLAASSERIDVETQPLTLVFTAVAYFTAFDSDQDGVDNLTERNQGTDPYDAASN